MKINCLTSEEVLSSTTGWEHFQKICKLCGKEYEAYYKIFKKIKCYTLLTPREEKDFLWFLSSEIFQKNYENHIWSLWIHSEKKHMLWFENIFITLNQAIINAKIITHLKGKNISHTDSNTFVAQKLDKTIYVQKIEECGDYVLWKNLKTGVFVLIYEGEVVLESRQSISFENQYSDEVVCVKGNTTPDSFLFLWNHPMEILEENYGVYEGKYGIYFINKRDKRVIFKDRKTNKINQYDFSHCDIIDQKEHTLLLFSRNTLVQHDEESDWSGGQYVLYDMEKNAPICGDIHMKYNHITKNGFICITQDEQNIIQYDFASKSFTQTPIWETKKWIEHYFRKIKKQNI